MACKPEYEVECATGKNDLGRIKECIIYPTIWVKPINAIRLSFQSPRSVPSPNNLYHKTKHVLLQLLQNDV